MITLVITFQGAVATAQGPVFVSLTVERVLRWEVADGQLRITQDTGDELCYNWAAVLGVVANPHGSIITPNIKLVAGGPSGTPGAN